MNRNQDKANQSTSGTQTSPFTQSMRFLVFVLNTLLVLLLGWVITGEFFPAVAEQRLWLMSAIALWLFALITAPWFRPPRDTLPVSISSILLLLFLDFTPVSFAVESLNVLRWVAVGFAALTAISAIFAILFKDSNPASSRLEFYLGRLGFRISDAFGKGEILLAPPALISIIGYYQFSPLQQAWLLLLWSLLVFVKPVELAVRFLDFVISGSACHYGVNSVGTIVRIDNPNIIRVELDDVGKWDQGNDLIACLPNQEQVNILPLFKHIQDTCFIGTGFICQTITDKLRGAVAGQVYTTSRSVDPKFLVSQLSGQQDTELIGFVVEDSDIGTIRFEVSPSANLVEGMLVLCKQNNEIVYYQIIDARTSEEAFDSNPRGRHIASAAQIGSLVKEKGFIKYNWLPNMNSPVFAFQTPLTSDQSELQEGEFILGSIPGSQIGVRVKLPELIQYHAAILGVTGTGKTEVALDIIREALKQGVKVFCVDFTEEYKTRLRDCDPLSLGLDEGQAAELDKKHFDIETTDYGAPKEKGYLKLFIDKIREPVKRQIDEFLTTSEYALGIYELPDITSTKAALHATELYLTTIMSWAKEHRKARDILIVLEEAHTIIPEISWMGYDDPTKQIVGRISQIALQGRKYGVGLLVVSQRTALVSKSILSQCNTYITFSLVDKTSLEYLTNVYSQEHVRAIPNLQFLETLAYGKAVLSQRPVLVKIPYDYAKVEASEALNRPIGNGTPELLLDKIEPMSMSERFADEIEWNADIPPEAPDW